VLGKLHPRFGSPYISLLVLGVVSSVIVVMSLAGSSVEQAYLAMGNASIILYFIPFAYLFLSHMVMNLRSQRKPFPLLLAAAGMVSTVIAIVLTFVPPSDGSAVIYLLEVVGGSFGFILVSLIFYFRGKKQISAG
ncbi:MAG TPA: amino acid permease, partial [Acidobacteriota bacterium]|nr:amino acid permease [Acidobacteriota bacterium]